MKILNMILDETKLKQHQKELEHYNGLLPLQLMTYIKNEEYINHLKKIGVYDTVQKEIFKRRNHTQFLSDTELINFEEKELTNWLKKNQEYHEVINWNG